MRSSSIMVLGWLLLVSCGGESPGELHIEHTELHRIVMKSDYDAVRIGAPERDVRRTLGQPELITTASAPVWRYRVWDGDKLGFLRMLFATGPPRGAQLLGDITFENGQVASKTLLPVPNDPFARAKAKPP